MTEEHLKITIKPETPESPVTLVQQPRTIRTYSVTDHEIETLSAPSGSPNLGLCGIAIGIAATTATTLATVTLSDPRTFAGFVGAMIASALLSVFFGYQAWKEIAAAREIRGTIQGKS